MLRFLGVLLNLLATCELGGGFTAFIIYACYLTNAKYNIAMMHNPRAVRVLGL